MDALRQVSGRYDAADFDIDSVAKHIEHDIGLLQEDAERWLSRSRQRRTPSSRR